jgi:hypothetical protein
MTGYGTDDYGRDDSYDLDVAAYLQKEDALKCLDCIFDMQMKLHIKDESTYGAPKREQRDDWIQGECISVHNPVLWYADADYYIVEREVFALFNNEQIKGFEG